MRWLFFDEKAKDVAKVVGAEKAHRIQKVLRMKPGDPCILSDGNGSYYEAKLSLVTKKHASFLLKKQQKEPMQTHSIRLAFGVSSKKASVELLAAMAVELGVSHLLPVRTARSEKAQLLAGRLRTVCEHAAEVAKRSYLVDISETISFEDFLKEEKEGAKYIADNFGEHELINKKIDCRAAHHICLIGPPGGFTLEEVQAAEKAGYVPVSLGHTVLRSHTAAAVAVAAMRHAVK